MEIMKPLTRRSHSLFIVSDFAENVPVYSKHEIADQYFHRPEILLWGGVASFLAQPQVATARDLNQGQGERLYSASFMLSSDYR